MTAVITREDDTYVALCPELGVATQGKSFDEAKDNLIEAVELLLEELTPAELEERLINEFYVTRIEVAAG